MKTGEKYLGMWEEDVRQVPGCVVNIDRIYYQGKFLNIKISGNRLMIFDSGAKFWREFAFAKYSGKGILFSTLEAKFMWVPSIVKFSR